MPKLQRLILGVSSLLIAALSFAGPSFSRSGYLTQDQLVEKQENSAKQGLIAPPAKSGVQLYKARYDSHDARGNPVRLTGLIMLPKGAPQGLVVYYHGTVGDRKRSPSRYTGQTNEEAELAMLAFATGGYAVAMPDYLGLGDDPGVHPYPSAEINAASGIDLIAPARLLAKQTGVFIGKRLLVTGYSEGGAVAMCAVRQMERTNLPVDLAAPMSGPYDLSGVTAQSLLKGKQSAAGLGMKLFLLGYAAYSAHTYLSAIDLKDYFAPSFASYVPYVFGQHLTEFETAKRLVIKAIQLGSLGSIRGVLTGKFREALQWGDATNPIVADLQKNDCYDWAPRTKMLLACLKSDGVVVSENTTKAVDAMRLRGVSSDRLRAYIVENNKLNHGNSVPATISAARRFFDGGFSAVWATGS